MPSEITTRWINLWEATEAEVAQIDFVLESRNAMKLALRTTRVLVKESAGRIIAFHVLQLIPHTEPLWIAEEFRGTDLAREMANEMVAFMHGMNARGWLCIADSPHAEALCREFKMELVTAPVYMAKGE
jgi:hypothetical protein